MPLTSICKSSGKAEEAEWLSVPTGPPKAPCPHPGSWILLLVPDVVPPCVAFGEHTPLPVWLAARKRGACKLQECFECFHFCLLLLFCSLVGVAGVSQVRRSFVTT